MPLVSMSVSAIGVLYSSAIMASGSPGAWRAAGRRYSRFVVREGLDVKIVTMAGGFAPLLKMPPAGQVDAAWLPRPLGVGVPERQRGAPRAELSPVLSRR